MPASAGARARRGGRSIPEQPLQSSLGNHAIRHFTSPVCEETNDDVSYNSLRPTHPSERRGHSSIRSFHSQRIPQSPPSLPPVSPQPPGDDKSCGFPPGFQTKKSSPHIPSYFICPITKEIMSDPVIDREGNTFERHAILSWLELEGNSPLTNNPLCTQDLIPNRAVKEGIEKARKEAWETYNGSAKGKKTSSKSSSKTSSKPSSKTSSKSSSDLTVKQRSKSRHQEEKHPWKSGKEEWQKTMPKDEDPKLERKAKHRTKPKVKQQQQQQQQQNYPNRTEELNPPPPPLGKIVGEEKRAEHIHELRQLLDVVHGQQNQPEDDGRKQIRRSHSQPCPRPKRRLGRNSPQHTSHNTDPPRLGPLDGAIVPVESDTRQSFPFNRSFSYSCARSTIPSSPSRSHQNLRDNVNNSPTSLTGNNIPKHHKTSGVRRLEDASPRTHASKKQQNLRLTSDDNKPRSHARPESRFRESKTSLCAEHPVQSSPLMKKKVFPPQSRDGWHNPPSMHTRSLVLHQGCS